MAERQKLQVSSRKRPQQHRSTELVTAILEAATQVLAKEGAHRFTTARVAERAGVSVGSIYQYFPNKAAILFRLQSDEWQQTTAMLRGTLADQTKLPTERLRILVHAFVRSECEEAAMRIALSDAAPLYRDAPEAQEIKASSDPIFQHFLREAVPTASDATQVLAGGLIATALSVVGKEFSETAHSPDEVEAYANAMADMFCAYVDELGRRQADE